MVTQIPDRIGRGSGGEDTHSRSPRAGGRRPAGARPGGVQAGVGGDQLVKWQQ